MLSISWRCTHDGISEAPCTKFPHAKRQNTYRPNALFEYSQFYDKEQDYVISFEHFFSNIDKELENIFRILDVDNIKSEDLVKLTQCPTCGNSELAIFVVLGV